MTTDVSVETFFRGVVFVAISLVSFNWRRFLGLERRPNMALVGVSEKNKT